MRAVVCDGEYGSVRRREARNYKKEVDEKTLHRSCHIGFFRNWDFDFGRRRKWKLYMEVLFELCCWINIIMKDEVLIGYSQPQDEFLRFSILFCIKVLLHK